MLSQMIFHICCFFSFFSFGQINMYLKNKAVFHAFLFFACLYKQLLEYKI